MIPDRDDAVSNFSAMKRLVLGSTVWWKWKPLLIWVMAH